MYKFPDRQQSILWEFRGCKANTKVKQFEVHLTNNFPSFSKFYGNVAWLSFKLNESNHHPLWGLHNCFAMTLLNNLQKPEFLWINIQQTEYSVKLEFWMKEIRLMDPGFQFADIDASVSRGHGQCKLSLIRVMAFNGWLPLTKHKSDHQGSGFARIWVGGGINIVC